MHVVAQGKFFSKLRNFQIYDALNQHIGKVGDLLLRKNDLSVYALISHDGVVKERLESIGILNDKDEIIPLHHIDRANRVPNQIVTTIEKKKLRTTSSRWELPEEYFLFSNLCKVNVIDIDGDAIGHISDIIYHEHDDYSIVVDPATYIQHFLEVLHIRHHHDIIVPSDYIEKISDDSIQLSIDREEIERMDALPVHMVLDKQRGTVRSQSEIPAKRYHYYIMQAPLYIAQEKLSTKGKKLEIAMSMLDIIPFDHTDEKVVDDFVTVFNDVAMTSVDPYEQLTEDKVKDHFKNGSYIAYYLKQPVGYCITTIQNEERIGAIAGIGVHHKFRGKRFSTAIMADTLSKFEEEDLEFVQCDVLTKNEASLGLFYGLGFKEIDDFYLS